MLVVVGEGSGGVGDGKEATMPERQRKGLRTYERSNSSVIPLLSSEIVDGFELGALVEVRVCL